MLPVSLCCTFLNAPEVFSIFYFLEPYSWLQVSLLIKLLYITHFCILDQSFNGNLFQNDGYKLFRPDRNCHGGGIMALLNTDFPSTRRRNLESENMENISIEVYINDKKMAYHGHLWSSINVWQWLLKWLIMGIYEAPSMSDNDFSTYS